MLGRVNYFQKKKIHSSLIYSVLSCIESLKITVSTFQQQFHQYGTEKTLSIIKVKCFIICW